MNPTIVAVNKNYRLLHTHVDRVTAIWQAMNYENINIDARESQLPRYTADSGTMESGDSHLEPWHTSAHHNTNDYWIADSTKTLESTFSGGYYYPETPVSLRNDQDAMKRFATQQVNALYAPSSVMTMITKLAPTSITAAPFDQAPLEEEAPPKEPALDSTKPQVSIEAANPSSDALKPIKSVEWRVFVRVKAFAVQGSWGIHLFFGEPPAESSEWFMSDNRVGTVNVLSNENLDACPNCSVQSASGLLVTGLVLLTNELRKRNIDINNQDTVVEYLKEKLTWRVAKDARNVEITPDMALVVGVSAREVVYPISASELPLWGQPQIFPAATAGKVGGLERDVEEL